MIVVPATLEHLPWLRRLFAALAAEQTTRFPAEYPVSDAEELDNFTLVCARNLGQTPTFYGLVALVDGLVVGFLAGEIATRAVGKPHLFGAPHWMYVLPEHRGHGIARALVAAGIAWLAAQGVTHVELAALSGDPQWGARGWTPYLTRYMIPLDGLAAVITAKDHDRTPSAADPNPGLNGHAQQREP